MLNSNVVIDIYRCEGQRPIAAFSFPDKDMLTSLLLTNDLSMLCSAREPFVLVRIFRNQCVADFQQDADPAELERRVRAALSRERHGDSEQNLTTFEVEQVTHHVVDAQELTRIFEMR